MCNRCGRIGHTASSCNQYVNFRQQNYCNYQGPDTWYYQPVAPQENYGYFQPTQPQAPPPGYQPAALPETHRPLALPPVVTQAPTQSRQQNVRSTHMNINPSNEENIPTNQMQNMLATVDTVVAPLVQAETQQLSSQVPCPEFWIENSSSVSQTNVLSTWCPHTPIDVLELPPQCLFAVTCYCGRFPGN